MLIRSAELAGERVDLRVAQGLIVELGKNLVPQLQERVIDAAGGAVLPGLHDHHIHLFALAAARSSVICGPPEINSPAELAEALLKQPGSGWLRGVGYHDSVAGSLDRWQLDKLMPNRPLRIQHRSGKMWVLNGLAMALLGLDIESKKSTLELTGIERDAAGRANGRLFRRDDWLASKLVRQSPPGLGLLSRELASYGLTGLTDTSATNSSAAMAALQQALEGGELQQRLLVMGTLELPAGSHPLLQRGAVKILLDEHRLPDFDRLLATVAQAHRQQRAVAIHCITPTELVFAATALLEVGGAAGDRIEHASIAPDETLPLLRRAGVTVVTQPGFLWQRGAQYLRDVAAAEQPLLYRGQAFLSAGIPLAGSSDAPYGDADPWLAIRAAVHRQTAAGVEIGGAEKLSPERALALFTTPATAPGSIPREIEVGAIADLCLLDRPWQQARQRLSSADVFATVRSGELIYQREPARS
jgi:predicted amidohydrolase YtcJ